MKATFSLVLTILVFAGFFATSAQAEGICGYQRNCWVNGACYDGRQGHYTSSRYCGVNDYPSYPSYPSYPVPRPGYGDDRYNSSSSNCYGTLLTVPAYGRNPYQAERYINCSVENCAGKVLRTPNSRRLITCY